MNVSGHLLSTAEIESAMVGHASVAEAAVVAAPDDIKGQVPYAFVTLVSVSVFLQIYLSKVFEHPHDNILN